MAWLNMKRLLLHRKVWKEFKNKLPLKLPIPNRSKAINKLKNRTPKKLTWRSLSIQPKKFKNKSKPHKRPPYVFVDHLFIEPAISVVKESVNPPVVAAVAEEESHNKEKPCSSGNLKKIGDCDAQENVSSDEKMISADEMWESMVMASPQMQGINERAEEFIARVRAEMHQQEMLARRL
ncbi:hypothetical protein CDL12_26663 [Handroanthus impetiginosus]|uniref:Uncharacterized protein n=1 Tax=Handroanthus impetiginosus TaxID=429701 RepID=A0A2G9G6A1_9LAMI|nr:hypothetical protein CDL12_26663 [Handroanthus impetiginosus]